LKNGFFGASEDVIDLLQNIAGIAMQKERLKIGNETEESWRSLPRRGRIIFLHSEPGTGKDTFATFAHLLNWFTSDTENVINYHRFWDNLALVTEIVDEFKATFGKPEDGLGIENYLDNKLKNPLKYSFNVLNCNELQRGRFEELLIGSPNYKNNCGPLLSSYVFCGTFFFDEFNTMEKTIINRFLRIFESPFEVFVPWKGWRIENANFLTVIASNKSRSELIDMGFNPAVITRIENEFEIPPLRRRKDDIAIFVLKKLLDVKNRYHESTEDYANRTNITRIDPHALRLICELAWKDNYRGLRAFMDDLVDSHVRHPSPRSEISFNEVVECISRRELLSAID
jgi:hypothetical protein